MKQRVGLKKGRGIDTLRCYFATYLRLLKLVNNDLQVARAWLRTSIRVLESVSPKEEMLQHDL